MIKKMVRDQVYALETYLEYVKEGDICENADVQRLAGSFDNREVNEMVYTVLTNDHIPEIILSECSQDNCIYITDGLQRTTMLKLFKHGNHKISSAIDNPIVEYMGKKRDTNGEIIKNGRGQVEFEEAKIDIRNKTYETLPEELQKTFDDFQMRIVIHEDCTMKRISELIKRYNYQRAMTSPQKAFTYMDNFAVSTRKILSNKFFRECSGYRENEKINGTMERVITESVMCMFHFEDWKKSPKSICEYLNKNSDAEEFNLFGNLVDQLGNIITPDFKKMFTSKNSFIWFNIFEKFTKLGLDNKRFSDFIHNFDETLKDKEVSNITYKKMDNITFAKLDKESGTKDKVLVVAKLELIETLMMEYLYFNIEETKSKDINILEFIRENVGQVLSIDENKNDILRDIEQEDIDFYEEMLNDLTLEVDNDTKLLDDKNKPSFLAIMAYSCQKDINLESWVIDFFNRTNNYIHNQRENYIKMCADLGKYILRGEKNRVSTTIMMNGGKLVCAM